MSKHTPGPWEERADAHGRGRVYAGGAWIATTWLATGDGNDAPQLPAIANARLIAAAPELLEALQYAIKQVPELATVPGIAASIAKTTGEQA